MPSCSHFGKVSRDKNILKIFLFHNMKLPTLKAGGSKYAWLSERKICLHLACTMNLVTSP